jgi:hypothetical protein
MVRIGVMVWLVIWRRLGLAILVCLYMVMREVGWGVLLVMRSPLHGVVHFPRMQLRRRLSGVLVYFSFGVDVDGAIFGFVIGVIAMVDTVQGLEVYGPRPHPQTRFKALPHWLPCGDLWSKVLKSICCRGPL